MTLEAFSPEALRDRRVLVLGLGRFSGGVETARYLQAVGATCRISDTASREALAASADEAESLGAQLLFGPQRAEDADRLLAGCDAVIASPAIPFGHPVLELAFARGLPVTTEVLVVLARSTAPVFGVTGTKGKSTTSTLLAAILEASPGSGRVFFGGNIGRALIGHLDQIGPDDRVVLELSSFQLWWAERAGVSPDVTVITNLFPDHLDRHGTMEAYAAAKRAALTFQDPHDLAVLPEDDPAVRAAGWFEAGLARRVTYGPGGTYESGGIDLGELTLIGRHNEANALAAAAAALAAGDADMESVRAGLRSVRPLPHRMEPVAEIHGILYVDDSNATNPKSTLCALESFEGPVVVLVGGKDKGLDAAELVAGIAARAHAVVGIGTTGPALVDALDRLAGTRPETAVARSMDEAVALATDFAPEGAVVLLSPAFSSLDEYDSFAARGDAFRAAALGLARAAERA